MDSWMVGWMDRWTHAIVNFRLPFQIQVFFFFSIFSSGKVIKQL